MYENDKYLIAIDLDGTIITDFANFDKETFDTITNIAKDHYVVIATGRPFRSSNYFYQLLNLKTPIINYNGALVHNPNDINFPKTMISVDRKDIINLVNDNHDIIINAFCEIEDEIFLWQKQDDINSYLHLEGGTLHIGNFKDTLYGDPNGAILFTKLDSWKQLEDYFINVKPHLRIRFWEAKDYIVSEVYSPKISKANALKSICSYYNIPFERLIAIGDGHNDIEMLQLAHHSVAMQNGHPDLIACAKYVAPPIEENGVNTFLRQFFKC